MKPRQLKPSDIPKLRKYLHKKQNNTCPILKQKFPKEDMVLDHLHTKHANLLKLENAGCVRGTVHRQANSFEGKIVNSFIRLGIHKLGITLPEILRNTAEYLEKKQLPYIHPSEAPKKKILTKSSYNKLFKAYLHSSRKAKFPVYRRNKKKKPVQRLTKPLEKLFNELNIKPEFYK